MPVETRKKVKERKTGGWNHRREQADKVQAILETE